MIKFPTRFLLLLTVVASVAMPRTVHADKLGRDASFLPPGDTTPSNSVDTSPLGPPPSASLTNPSPTDALPPPVQAVPLTPVPPVAAVSAAPIALQPPVETTLAPAPSTITTTTTTITSPLPAPVTAPTAPVAPASVEAASVEAASSRPAAPAGGPPSLVSPPAQIYSARPVLSYSEGATSATSSTSIGGDPAVTGPPGTLPPPGGLVAPVVPAAAPQMPQAIAPVGTIYPVSPVSIATSNGEVPPAPALQPIAPSIAGPTSTGQANGMITISTAAPSAAPTPITPTVITSTPAGQTMVVHDSSAAFAPPPIMAPLPPAPVLTPGAVSNGAPAAVPEIGATATTDVIQPVQTTVLGDINPESIGLLGTAEGGLGSDMWRGTPRALVQRLLPSMAVPSASPTMNNLATRFLLSTSSAPKSEGSEGELSLVAMRAEKLVALGSAVEAWKLVQLSKPNQINDETLRLVAEAALITRVGSDVCAKLPEIIKTHTAPEWQKSLLVCQLRAKDMPTAQISLDLLHTQNVKDDLFFALAEKNIMGTSKQLPRALTPLKPLSLALLRVIDLPLRDEVYARPEPNLIPELLKVKAVNEKPRLDLAERAASHGWIDATALADVYRSQVFAPDDISKAALSTETGARLRALLYQSSQQDPNGSDHIAIAYKFLQSMDATQLSGAMPLLLLDMIGSAPPTSDFNTSSDSLALINILGGKPDAALGWLKVARVAAIGLPNVAAGLTSYWPLLPLAGLETDKDYARDLGAWLDSILKPGDAKPDTKANRKMASIILLILEADGFSVPEEAWAKVAEVPEFEKQMAPSAFLLDRLRTAGISNLRGQAVLTSLILSDANGEMPMATMLEVIRTLRLVGLTADASGLARETAIPYLGLPYKP